jgi:hypothetical protein
MRTRLRSWSWIKWKEWPLSWLWSRIAALVGIGVVLLFFAGQIYNHAPTRWNATSTTPAWEGNVLVVVGLAWITGTLVYSLVGLTIRRRAKARDDDDALSGLPL